MNASEQTSDGCNPTFASRSAADAYAVQSGMTKDEALMRVCGCIPFDGRFEIRAPASAERR